MSAHAYSEERTKEVFGDYVSIYDFQQSIEDGARQRGESVFTQAP